MREVRPHDVSPSGPIEDSLLGRSGILISGVRLDVHINPSQLRARGKRMLAVLANCGAVQNRSRGTVRPVCWVTQTDQVQFVSHCSKLPPDGSPGRKASTVVHELKCAIEATNLQWIPSGRLIAS